MHTWGLQYIYASLHPIFHPYSHAVLSIKQYRMPFFHSVVVYTGAELALEHIHCFSASVTIPLFSESRIPLIYLLNNYTTHCFISSSKPQRHTVASTQSSASTYNNCHHLCNLSFKHFDKKPPSSQAAIKTVH